MAPTRPNKKTDRIGWNKSWERELSGIFASRRLISVYKGMPQQTLQFIRQSSTRLQDDFNSQMREVCTLQRDLVKAVVPAFAHEGFEEKWRALTQKRREELVLEGLYVTSCAGPDMEDRRRWCPEMTVETLAGNNDKDLIQLLKLLLPKDQIKNDLTAPIYLPNAEFEKMVETDPNDHGLRRLVDMHRLQRMYFVTMTLWSTFNVFNGVREQVRTVKVSRRITKEDKDVLRAAEQVLGKSEIKEIRRSQERAQVTICWNCKRDEDSLGKQGRELKACGKCKAIGRITRYCSRDCQLADWKYGFPVPHKNICGKKGYDDNEGTSQPDQITPPSSGGSEDADDAEIDTGIPAPEPSFKRSPALLHQISFHTGPDSFVDYVFVRPYPQDDHGVSLGLDDDKMKFLIMRRRAMKTGDEAAVATMYKMLLPYAEKLAFGATKLKAQLKIEYGVDVDTVKNLELSPVTAEEKQIGLTLMMKGLMMRDSYSGPKIHK
ncbi:hypothetical protein IW262DRAFT_256649 [Armillaria fumosa]|nr:hypothetical protein IW262DRAFT_256649 [Armillaria fumosa]